MKRTHNGRAGSIAVAWRPVSSSRISLPIEIHSLFLITGNLSLWRRKRWGILDQIAPGESDIDKFPCIFPIEQGSAPGDEFATDWFHRHSVCVSVAKLAGSVLLPIRLRLGLDHFL